MAMQFLTLTVPHATDMPLKTSMSAVEAAWKAARSGSPYRRLRSVFGLYGIVNIPDVTYGNHGWHLHVHTILFAETPRGASECAEALRERYECALAARGWVVNDLTVDMRPVTDPQGLSNYLTRSWHRPARDGRTPFELLSAAERGCIKSGELFFEAADEFRNKPRGFVPPLLARMLRKANG